MIKLYVLSVCFCCFISTVNAQSVDEMAVRETLRVQTEAWNAGDIPAFMKGYWKNDSLAFIGKSGATYGWQNTLDNYIKGYPDKTAMGQLQFDLLEVKRLSVLYFFVIGKWQLTRSIGDIGGTFTLLFKKIKNKWVIVVDHTS
ncbi:MAG: DUF4440 domain-containing protein [Ferruginibacter sp.]